MKCKIICQATIIFLCISCCPLFLFAQQSIKGKVINVSTGASLANCNVFINNTTRGTVTDKNGYFELSNVPPGKHELIISSVGYETKSIPFTHEQLPLDLEVKLSIRVRELENVTVEPFEEGNWEKWGNVFTGSFIGNVENAAHCKIINKDSVRFRYYKKSNRLVAYSEGPLLIENKALGYILSYQLEEFILNYKDKSLFYFGYPLIKKMEHDRKAQLEKWEKKRAKAYAGSVLHFMRSVYNNRLVEEGFEVRRMVKRPNKEKQRILSLYQPKQIHKVNASTGRTTVEYTGASPDIPRDSLKYYNEVLLGPDYLDEYGKNILTADSLTERSDGNEKILFFPDYLFITYKNETEEQGYLQSKLISRRPSYQRSEVILLGGNAISIEANGHHFDPTDFFLSGYWGWSEKMADYLPLDYEVNKK